MTIFLIDVIFISKKFIFAVQIYADVS